MGYKYQAVCHDTLYDFHVAFAQNCHASGSGQLGAIYLSCTADSGGYVVMQSYNASNGTPGTAWNYTPQAIPCEVSLTNQTGFMWELALILIAGFSIRAIIKAFQ